MNSNISCGLNPEGTMMICKALVGNNKSLKWEDISVGVKLLTFALIIFFAIIILSIWFYIIDRWVDNGNMTQTQKYIMTIAVYLAVGTLSSNSQIAGNIIALLFCIVLIIFLIEYLTGRYILPEKKFIN